MFSNLRWFSLLVSLLIGPRTPVKHMQLASPLSRRPSVQAPRGKPWQPVLQTDNHRQATPMPGVNLIRPRSTRSSTGIYPASDECGLTPIPAIVCPSTLPRSYSNSWPAAKSPWVHANALLSLSQTASGSLQLQGPSFCPSCMGRRRNEGSANLVGHVLPEHLPIRLWVLTLPYPRRYPMPFDPLHLSHALSLFTDTIGAWYARHHRYSKPDRSRSFSTLPPIFASTPTFMRCLGMR